MHPDQDPSEKNRSDPRFRQSAVSHVEAENIQIGRIVQTIIYLGLPFNRRNRRLMQGNVRFIPKLLLITGSGLLTLACIYYAWFWKPELQDTSLPVPEILASEEQIKAQQAEKRWRTKVRYLALMGVIATPLLTSAGFLIWQNLPTKDTIILVTEFSNQQSNSDDRGVTRNIFEALRNATRAYSDIRILALKKSITAEEGSEIARAKGKQRKATIVIWGWYDETPQAVQVSTHFEVLKPPEIFPELGQEATGAIRTIPAPIAKLEHFELQTRLSEEMTYLSLFTTGMALYTAEDWNGAIAHFTDALNQVKEPVSALDQGNVYNARGNSYRSQGDYDRALADYTQAIEANPQDFRPHFSEAVIHLFRRGDYTRAIDAFTQVIELKPDSEFQVLSYSLRGRAYKLLGDYDQALADCTQAIQLKSAPSADVLAKAYIYRGEVYEAQGIHNLDQGDIDVAKGNFDRAIADYTQAIEISSNDIDVTAYQSRGHRYSLQGENDLAIADFNQLIRLNSGDIDTYYARGLAYFTKGLNDLNQKDIGNANANFNRAIADYGRSIRLDPDDARAYTDRGNIYLIRGNYVRAIDDLTRAIQLFPENELAVQSDPNLAILDSNRARQREIYRQLLTLAYSQRGDAYKQRGDKNKSISDFKKVLELTEDPERRQDAEQQLQELGVQ